MRLASPNRSPTKSWMMAKRDQASCAGPHEGVEDSAGHHRRAGRVRRIVAPWQDTPRARDTSAFSPRFHVVFAVGAESRIGTPLGHAFGSFVGESLQSFDQIQVSGIPDR